ncbi:MAG TPA: MepB family protein, partial [Chitinophagales bacterium]|nr:MepB family protein [Chitinophagales bacterium]
GQFVSIWKRNKQGITEPFNISDEFDLYIIATRHNQKFGLFIFSKTILLENKILSDTKKVGKRGIRVYPTWDETTNKQAQKTQHWQTKYFLEITQGNQINTAIVRSLCKLNKQ